MAVNGNVVRHIQRMRRRINEEKEKRKSFKELDLFVLDNSLRESTVGQLRGYTVENKWKIYEQIKKVGFEHIIVASFSDVTRFDDTFIRQLKERGEDFTNFYAFAELHDSVDRDGIPDTKTIPSGLRKMKELGIKNAIIETDLAWAGINYNKFTVQSVTRLLSKRMKWCRKNLSKDSKIFVNIRDLPHAMVKKPERVIKVVKFLSSLQPHKRPFGLMYEESGQYLPQELSAWTEAIRNVMDECGFERGHLLFHVHEQWGLSDSTQLECLASGANGIWASLIVEGAALGHACSTVTLMNLIRLGNRNVIKKFNCVALREASREVTRITTGFEPYNKQVVYGERALDMVFGAPNFPPGKQEFDIAKFFGEEPPIRITTLATTKMVIARLKQLFGDNDQFTEEIAQRMLEVMQEDLHQNRKEEYMSSVGIALLFDRSGGKLTQTMCEVIAQEEPRQVHAQALLAEIRASWDEWDLRDGKKGDKLDFDAFYNGFMRPYFGRYRCDETRRALQAIDMDADGNVEWDEFAVYLKWAIRQYPETETAEELLSIAFRKGLIPAMQDEVLKQGIFASHT